MTTDPGRGRPGNRRRRAVSAASTRRVLPAVLPALLAAAACGRPAPAPPPPVARCIVVDGTGAPTAPVTLGLTDPVDARRAPEGANDAERLLFRQLYETLVWKDCGGTLRPGLAMSWQSRDGGRRWLFRIRPAARFWDGRPVRSVDVLSAWADVGPGTAFDAPDDSTVAVMFAEPVAAPEAVAHPRFAVHGYEDGAWRMGTSPAGRVRHQVAADGRDLLERGVDLLVTRHPDVIAFAEGLPERYSVHALPWDRAYVLAVPRGAPVGVPRDAEWAAAVRAPVRPPADSAWWTGLEACLLPGTPRAREPMLGFPEGDRAARDLAARVAALSDPAVRTRGVQGAPSPPAVLVFPLRPYDPCRAARRAGLTAAADLQRLVDTRATLIVRRRAVPPIVLAWDGIPRIVQPGR